MNIEPNTPPPTMSVDDAIRSGSVTQYGTTVADAVRFLRTASFVQVAVRADLKHGDAEFLVISPRAIRRALNMKRNSECLPCELKNGQDLIIGSLESVKRAAIAKAEGRAP